MLVVQLYAYRFDMASLKLIYTNGQNELQMELMGPDFAWSSSCCIVASLTFQMFICDLFYFTDNTPSSTLSKKYPD